MRQLTGSAAFLAAVLATTAALAQSEPVSTRTRTRIVIHPRSYSVEPPPSAKRYCTSWLQKEYRVSGPVIVPRMRCWWQ
jgi:hypothetical protein